MANEHSQAISVAHCYFLLADDLFPGLKDHLAEDVTLNWFGRNIKGRQKVVNFMLCDKKRFTHTFDEIAPSSNITWGEKNKLMRRRFSDESVEETKDDAHEQLSLPRRECAYRDAVLVKECETKTNSEKAKSSERFQTEQENDADDPDSVEKNFDARESSNETRTNLSTVCDYANDHLDNNDTDDTNASAELNDGCYDLNENDLRNLFEPEITSQTVEEIQNINRIKLEEEMAPTIRAVDGERDREGRLAETGTLKYLTAIGKIKLSQKNTPKDYAHYQRDHSSIRKYKCSVQIAYSSIEKSLIGTATSSQTAEENYTFGNIYPSHLPTTVQCDEKEEGKDTEKYMEKKERTVKREEEEARSLSVEEFIQASSQSDYFESECPKAISFVDDRKRFIKDFEDEVRKNNPEMHFSIYFQGNKLRLSYPDKASLYVTYQIHTIVYTKLRKSKVYEEAKGDLDNKFVRNNIPIEE